MTVKGAIELTSMGGDKTEARFELTMDIKGALGMVLRPMISSMIGSRVDVLAQCVKERSEGSQAA